MGNQRDKLLVVRLSTSEHEFIKEEAKFRGITLTRLVRQALHMFLKETTKTK